MIAKYAEKKGLTNKEYRGLKTWWKDIPKPKREAARQKILETI